MRPSATSVAAQRPASACAAATASGPRAGPAAPTVTGPTPALPSSRCTVLAATPGARSGRQSTTHPSWVPARPPRVAATCAAAASARARHRSSTRTTTTACGRSRSAPRRRARSRTPSGSRTVLPSSSSSSSPRTRFSASPAVRRMSSSSAVTRAARSRMRWSASDRAASRCRTRPPSSSLSTVTAAVHQLPSRTVRPVDRARSSAAAGSGGSSTPAVGVRARGHPSLLVQHGDGAAECLGDRGRDVLDPAAPQHDVDEPVVGTGRPLDRRGVGAQLAAGRRQLVERGAGLLEEAGVVQGDRRVRRQRPEQGHLRAVEGPLRPVGGEQDADDLRPTDQRDAEDGDEPFLADAVVDLVRVPEAGVGEVARPSRTAPTSGRPGRRGRRPWAAGGPGSARTPSRRSPACTCRRARGR